MRKSYGFVAFIRGSYLIRNVANTTIYTYMLLDEHGQQAGELNTV